MWFSPTPRRSHRSRGRSRPAVQLGGSEALETRQLLAVDLIAPISDQLLPGDGSALAVQLGEAFRVSNVEQSVVRVDTNAVSADSSSTFFLELFDGIDGFPVRPTPATAGNFLSYVDQNLFDGAIFHRSVGGLLQTGGYVAPTGNAYLPDGSENPNGFPTPISSLGTVEDEVGNPNVRGTLAMAKTLNDSQLPVAGSASKQWFVNVLDNPDLDDAYTVFGRVLGDGMDVLDALSRVPAADASVFYSNSAFRHLPLWDIPDGTNIRPEDFLTITSMSRASGTELVQLTATSLNPDLLQVEAGGSSVILSRPGDLAGVATVHVRATSLLDADDYRDTWFNVSVPQLGTTVLETVGSVSLTTDVAGYLRADGAVIQFGGNPVHYQGMIDQGWTAVAADVIESVNTLVFQQNGTGVLHFWRLSDSWVQQESYGWQQPGSAEAYASEVAFGMDFDADGFLGGPPLAVESAGSITLGRNAAGEYFAGSGGSWTPIIYEGFPLSDATFPGFLTPVAAERVDGTNQVLFRNPGGPLITFSFNDSWAYTATNDWANPGTADYYALETGFGIDVDSDGTIGQPAPPPAIATPDIDFNGNGLTDVIWQGPDNVVVVHIDGDQAQARVLGGGGGWSLAATGDFNGDGVTDVIWRNDPVGSHYLWVLQDFTPVAQTQLAVAPGRALEATGDYNGDGTTDLIWRNTANGRNNMWLMNGTEILGKQSIGGDTDWRLVATGERFDANDDGRTDLIWRSSVSGVSTLWLLAANGMPEQTRFLGGNGIWSIVNTGDFDGDGHGDVLWREGTSGVVVMHRLVDGYLQSATVLGGNLEWSVSGTLDADSDGKSDVYWRNLAGIVVRHLMDGGSVRNSAIVGGNDVWRMLGRPGQQL